MTLSLGGRVTAFARGARSTANATTCKPPECLLRKPGAPTSPLFSFRAARTFLSQNTQIYEPHCHWCGAYLKPFCQEDERLLIVEIKIMFANFLTD